MRTLEQVVEAVQVAAEGQIAPRTMAALQRIAAFDPIPRRPRTVLTGSSYTEQQALVSGSNTILTIRRSWIDWANIFLKQSLKYDVFIDTADPLARNFRGSNFGVSGQSSTEIDARKAEMTELRPDIAIVQMGSNNITDPATVFTDIKSTLTALRIAGATPVFMSIIMRGTGSWDTATGKRALKVNHQVKTWCDETGIALYCESNKYLCDPDDANGRPATLALDSDGVHLNDWSAFQVGKALKEVLEYMLPRRIGAAVPSQLDAYDATYNPYGNLIVNPKMSSNTGIGTTAGSVGTGVTAGSGAAATSVARNRVFERNSGSGTAVATLESRGPGQGNWQKLVVTPAGSGSSVFYLRNGAADITHGLAAGTWCRAGCAVKMSTFGTDANYSGFQAANLVVDLRDASTSKGKIAYMDRYGAYNLPNEAWEGVYETPPFQIPVNCDRFRWRNEIYVDDTKDGTGSIYIGDVWLRPIDDPTTIWANI